MADEKITRRDFVCDTAVAAAGVAAGLGIPLTVQAGNPDKLDTRHILNYNPDMEYRRCGRTNLMTSCVCMGGHWKRLNKVIPGLFKGESWLSPNLDDPEFRKNRYEVVTRCIERGINHIDACTRAEVYAYAKALQGRRDKMYLHYSWYEHEARSPQWCNLAKLQQGFDEGLKMAGLEYVDVWRITCHEQSSRHTPREVEEIIKALAWAKKSGRARFTGISSHDRPHIKHLIEKYPDQLDVIVTPYTARSKLVTDETGLWASMRKLDVGWFGIKPFSSGSLFNGDGTPGNPHEQADNRLARLALRYILCNPAITAPIPGLATPANVDNVALAVKEHHELDAQEHAELRQAMDRAWSRLPHHYQWLKDWEYV